MHNPKNIWLKAHVPGHAIRTLLMQNGWTWEKYYPRVNFRESTLYFAQNEILASYHVIHDLGVHYLHLYRQNNDENGDDLQAAAEKLKAGLASWAPHELHENLRSSNLFDKIEALHILVFRVFLEKKNDPAVFTAVQQFMHDPDKILRVIASRLCYYLVYQYTDEILKLARRRIVEDTELEVVWNHLAKTIEE